LQWVHLPGSGGKMLAMMARNLWKPALVAALTPLLAGCVERTISVQTTPPGALVTINDVEVGRTPVKTPFLWYGDYDLRLRLTKNEGTPDEPKVTYYYLHTHQQVRAPWFQWLGIDLATELLPLKFEDQQQWTFALPEVQPGSDEVLVKHAKELSGQLEGTRIKPAGVATTQPTK
jgi:hypothetical protein